MSDPTSTKYKIAYILKPLPGDGMTKEEMQAHPKYGPEGWGGTDKCVVASIIESSGGSRSIELHSRQHDGGPLPAVEIYELIMLLCRKLAMDGELGETREAMCWAFFNANLELMGLNPQDLDRARKLFAGEGPTLARKRVTDD